MSLEGYKPKNPKRALTENRKIAADYHGPALLALMAIPVIVAIVAVILGWPWWVYVVCGFLFLFLCGTFFNEQNDHLNALERIEFLEKLLGAENGRPDETSDLD